MLKSSIKTFIADKSEVDIGYSNLHTKEAREKVKELVCRKFDEWRNQENPQILVTRIYHQWDFYIEHNHFYAIEVLFEQER